jgi:hypothetical protein
MKMRSESCLRTVIRELERHFVCVNWDQRGAGRSLRPGPDPATMTIDQLISDTIALIEYLRMSGLRFSIPRMGEKLLAVNLLQEISEPSVPVWFFEGRHDYTAPVVLAEEFYASLAAPSKRLRDPRAVS